MKGDIHVRLFCCGIPSRARANNGINDADLVGFELRSVCVGEHSGVVVINRSGAPTGRD
jgi:hypothetical protein